MSEQGSQDQTEAAAQPSALDNIVGVVGEVVAAIAPVVEAADPAIAAAVSVGAKIVQGAIALEPQAVALFNQIRAGTPPTAAQLAQYAGDYEAAYQQLNADIAAKLAALPPATS